MKGDASSDAGRPSTGLFAPGWQQWRHWDSMAGAWSASVARLPEAGNRRTFLLVRKQIHIVRRRGRQTGFVHNVAYMIPHCGGRQILGGQIERPDCGLHRGLQNPRRAASAECLGRRMERRWSHHADARTGLGRRSRRTVFLHCSYPTPQS
jgi:hypothetical protein